MPGARPLKLWALARQASELAQESSARLAVQESAPSEVALQRSQLEEPTCSLRSRDENLVVDIEANVRLAQQAQLTGSVQPLVASIVPRMPTNAPPSRAWRAARPGAGPGTFGQRQRHRHRNIRWKSTPSMS